MEKGMGGVRLIYSGRVPGCRGKGGGTEYIGFRDLIDFREEVLLFIPLS